MTIPKHLSELPGPMFLTTSVEWWSWDWELIRLCFTVQPDLFCFRSSTTPCSRFEKMKTLVTNECFMSCSPNFLYYHDSNHSSLHSRCHLPSITLRLNCIAIVESFFSWWKWCVINILKKGRHRIDISSKKKARHQRSSRASGEDTGTFWNFEILKTDVL